ncbi:MAG: tRNA pseudouridine(55) synthase TruB, partial [Verrucomicrobia bacterium]|nr:tRNA pseudouridine(55) synthase TruB [Verrucomicrobiota bacterium]
FDGVLVLDKPSGPTSHDMVDRVRRLFGIRKVGHGGTLDPMATGVLVMLLGRATKMSSLFLGSDKTYEGTINLGISTDSHDAVGTITAEKEWRGITREQLEAVMATFHGDMMQTPPMVSAIKINGVPLYKHARKGETVAREARLIHIYAFTLTRFSPPDADFVLRCTKGTYVRKICADIGDALGCGAHLSRLRRTHSGSITIDQAVTAAQLSTFSREDLMRHLLPAAQFAAARHSAREPQSP